jgi:hypothetical protein
MTSRVEMSNRPTKGEVMTLAQAKTLPDKLRIELNRLSMALSRCMDQAKCDGITARIREIEERRA